MRFRIFPDSPLGAVAQLGERLVRNEEVGGSIPLSSTFFPSVELKYSLENQGVSTNP
jgi:hypothetical protein